ncbi:hypothetical protein [Rubripirellula lacrimiformis]|nr:hypothetical protein [Rubripirellula lacrimiformis]
MSNGPLVCSAGILAYPTEFNDQPLTIVSAIGIEGMTPVVPAPAKTGTAG